MQEKEFASKAVERMQGVMDDLSRHLHTGRLAMAEDDLEVLEESIHQLRRGIRALARLTQESRGGSPQANWLASGVPGPEASAASEADR
jgi:phage shock protein A